MDYSQTYTHATENLRAQQVENLKALVAIILREIAKREGRADLTLSYECLQILNLLLTQAFYCVSKGLRVVRRITPFVMDYRLASCDR